MLKDKKHAKLTEKLIKTLTKNKPTNKKQKIETEEPYNHYGERGYIDVVEETWIETKNQKTDKFLHLYEVKPTITNLNKTIRQCKKAYKYYKPNHNPNTKYETHNRTKIIDLLIEPTEQNLETLKNHRQTLNKSFKEIGRIAFFKDTEIGYCYPTNEFDGLWELKKYIRKMEVD